MTAPLRKRMMVLAAAALVAMAARPARCLQQESAMLPDAPLPQQSSSPSGPAPQANAPPDTSWTHPAPCVQDASTIVPQDRSCASGFAAPKAEKLARFANSAKPLGLTPTQKFHLAVKNVKDPFNLASIAFFSALDIATDSHGPYGPGMAGFARDAGTTLTEEINGQFWGTFVVASIAHQDPHYHRMPQASIQRRIVHCFDAVLVAQSDTGKAIPNYEEIVAAPITASINNLYVPYPRTNVASTVARIATGAAFEPIGNAITEFLPDVAKHVNVRIVIVQRVINRLYAEETGGATLQ